MSNMGNYRLIILTINFLTRAHLLVVTVFESENFHCAAEIQLQWQLMEIRVSCLKTLEDGINSF